jgi:3-dehydroquinate synthase
MNGRHSDGSAVAAPRHEDVIHVPVELGERAYDILIGPDLIEAAGERIAAATGAKRAAVVSDTNTVAFHGVKLDASLASAGIATAPVVVAPGEQSKSYEAFCKLCEAIIAAKIGRDDVVVALGGGVVGDLAGFAAASVRRGLRLVQVPTTLLAQVDSSVGGKTGINSPQGKNLVGAFHQPSLVISDTNTLDTLPTREFRAGYAEVMKYGLIDRSAFFDWLESKRSEVFAGGAARAEAIAECCRAKAQIVARDETETGDRALLNLGHTFAHALEAVTSYDGTRLVHGEAVAIGCAMAFRFSAKLGLADSSDARRVETHLSEAGLPWRLSHVPGGTGSADALMEAMAQDKKVKDGALTFILVRGIGRAFIARGMERATLREFLVEELRADA